MSQTKKALLVKLIISVIISFTLGLLCVLVDGTKLLNIIFIIIGAFLLIDGIIGVINNHKNSSYLLIVNSISIVLGILLMFNFNPIINILIAIYFIAIPLYEIIKNKYDKKEELKEQLPKMIIALLIIIFGIGGVFDVLLKILGWGLIIFAISYLTLGIISLNKQ